MKCNQIQSYLIPRAAMRYLRFPWRLCITIVIVATQTMVALAQSRGDVNPANIINVEEEVRALNFDFLKKRSEGKDEQAIAVVRKAIEISEKQLGENNLYTGISLNNLGVLYISQNKLAEAKTLLQRAQKVFERTLGPDHPETAASLNNLARVYFRESNYAEALPLHQRALKIYEKTRGPDHPDTARNLGYLANVYFALGNHAAALSLQQRALAIERRNSGPITQIQQPLSAILL